MIKAELGKKHFIILNDWDVDWGVYILPLCEI